jgi:hypothetical protein
MIELFRRNEFIIEGNWKIIRMRSLGELGTMKWKKGWVDGGIPDEEESDVIRLKKKCQHAPLILEILTRILMSTVYIKQ